MILKPGRMAGISAKVLATYGVVLTAYHPAQTRKEALSHVGVNPVLAIGI